MPPITDPAILEQIKRQQQIGAVPPAAPPDDPDYMPAPRPFPGARSFETPKPMINPQREAAQKVAAGHLAISENADRRAEQESHEVIDDTTAQFYAQQILAGGQMPALGMGRQAAHSRAVIMNKVAEMGHTAGLGGADLATQQAHYKSAAKAIATLETQYGVTQQNEDTALKNGQQFIDRSLELPMQTGTPALNAIIQFGQKQSSLMPGHETKAAMDAAWNTFVTEYAKVVAGSPTGAGVLSDSARHEQMEVMQNSYDPKQKLAAFEQMKADMANRIAAMKATLAKSYENLTKQPDKVSDSFTAADPGTKQISTETKTVEIPKGYQMDHAAMLAHHTPGTLTIGQYIQIRKSLDNKYHDELHGGNSRLDPAEVEKFVHDYNEGHAGTKIPALNVKLSADEKSNAELAASPLGTAAANFANAATFGAVDAAVGQEGRDKMHLMEDANPKSALAGEVLGSLAPMKGLEKGGLALVKKVAPNLTASARKRLLGDLAVNATYGADRGFMGADDGEGASGAAAGALGGAVGTGVGTVVAKGARPLLSDAAQASIDKLSASGVKMTTLQKLGLGKAEEGLSGIPLAHGARKASLESYNIANGNEALKHIGGKLPKGIQPGTAVNEEINKQANAAYNQIRPHIVGAADGQFVNAITAIKAGAATPEKKAMFSEIKSALDKFANKTTGHYDGQGYKEASERLRYLAKTWSNRAEAQGDVAAGDMARAAEQARKQVQFLVQRQTPEVGTRLKNIERTWAHSVRIEDASNRALANNEAVYSPAQHLTSIKKLDTSTRKGASARGKAFGQDYATAAARTLGPSGVPKVSIKETTYVLGALGLGGYAQPAAVPIVTAMAAGAYGPGVKRVVQVILSGKRPTAVDNQLVRRAIEDAVRHKTTGN